MLGLFFRPLFAFQVSKGDTNPITRMPIYLGKLIDDVVNDFSVNTLPLVS
jgi:hypothetical protein